MSSRKPQAPPEGTPTDQNTTRPEGTPSDGSPPCPGDPPIPEGMSLPEALGPGALEELRRARSLLDALGDGILLLNADGLVLVANRALLDLVGAQAEEVQGRHIQQLEIQVRVGERLHPPGLRPPEGALEGPGEAWARTFQVERPDGTTRAVAARFQCTDLPGCERPVLLGQLRDVTREMLWNRERDLARAPDNLGRLGFQLAHEILNPVHSIDIQIQLLTRLLHGVPGAESGEIEDTLQLVRKEIRRLANLLSETLQLSHPEVTLRSQADVGALLHSLSELVRAKAEGQGVELVVDVQAGLPRVRMDVDRLRRALLNLAINALEAMPDGGVLQLTARGGPERVTLGVADSGPGIPEDVRDQAFDFFVSTKSSGTGMGLPLARSIVEEHGGSLRLVEGEGGAEFEVSLPV